MKKVEFTCDKCGKIYTETAYDADAKRIEINVQIINAGRWSNVDYHYCSEECYNKRLEP